MAPPVSFISRVKSLDIYRKVPRDLTEPSIIGGTISLFSYAFLLILFIIEMRNFFTTEYMTTIEVDHGEDGVFQINFNLTLPGLSCEFAAVDVNNIIGRTKRNINDRTIHKYTLDGSYQGPAIQKKLSNDKVNLKLDANPNSIETDRDHYGNTRHALELKADTFVDVIDSYEVMLVDFHAPWCPHCQHLAPIYEHAADLVQQRAPHTIDSYHKYSVALGTFDCTEPDNIKLCRDNHIQAYPTILVFRKSENKAVGRSYRGFEVHESYAGSRDADGIASFALKVLKEVTDADPNLSNPEGMRTGPGLTIPDSHVRTRGCRIEGYVMVQKVPGQIIIRPYSESHTMNTSLFSVDHRINHLSFGRRKPSLVRKLVKDSMDGAYAEHLGRPVILAEGEEEIGFVSPGGRYVHEHYLKVVSTTLLPLSGRPEHAYEYTINSNMYEPGADDGEGVKYEVPEIVFSFDLSPLKVFVKEKRKRFSQEIINIMALIGGVFSCSIIFEGILSKAILSVAKKLD